MNSNIRTDGVPDNASQLDIVSESLPPVADRRPTAKTSFMGQFHATRPIYFQFSCCRVASRLTMPSHVLAGEASTWRVHCPRCGLLTEVSVID